LDFWACEGGEEYEDEMERGELLTICILIITDLVNKAQDDLSGNHHI
jgi:hypothetical protein